MDIQGEYRNGRYDDATACLTLRLYPASDEERAIVTKFAVLLANTPDPAATVNRILAAIELVVPT